MMHFFIFSRHSGYSSHNSHSQHSHSSISQNSYDRNSSSSNSSSNHYSTATSSMPIHPDVKFINLPFYSVIDVLVKPTSLGKFSWDIYVVSFTFFLAVKYWCCHGKQLKTKNINVKCQLISNNEENKKAKWILSSNCFEQSYFTAHFYLLCIKSFFAGWNDLKLPLSHVDK